MKANLLPLGATTNTRSGTGFEASLYSCAAGSKCDTLLRVTNSCYIVSVACNHCLGRQIYSSDSEIDDRVLYDTVTHTKLKSTP